MSCRSTFEAVTVQAVNVLAVPFTLEDIKYLFVAELPDNVRVPLMV